MIQPLAIMNHFEIPCFAVFDADAHEKDAGKRAAHEKDNKAILSLCNVAKPEPLPAATQWHPNCTMWHTEIGAVVKEDFGKDVWEKSFNKCQALHDANVGDLHKNTLFIGSLMEHTWNQNVKSKSLEKLCDSILDFTELVTGSSDTTLVVKEKKIIREIPGPHDSLAPKT
jgi:hypothetical protein